MVCMNDALKRESSGYIIIGVFHICVKYDLVFGATRWVQESKKRPISR